MRHSVKIALGALALAGPAGAVQGKVSVPTPGPEATEEPEEVIVIADRFARWDHTRWYAEMQIGFPLPYPMYAEQNWETRLVALQVRSVLSCEKTWRRGNRSFEVICDIEDISLRGVSYEDGSTHATDVLQDIDRKLTDTSLQLYVSDNGRVDNLDLAGFPGNNDREKAIRESTRQIMRRLMASFHMRLPRTSAMTEGQWMEYESPIFLLPTPVFWSPTGSNTDGPSVIPGGGSSGTSTGITSMGGGYLLHQLDKYRGKLVVQSKGVATVSDGQDDQPNYYSVNFDGVSIYDPDSGIMTERVYALQGQTTASSATANGFAGGLYFHAGRIQMLNPTDKVPVGFTGQVVPEALAAKHPELPRWKPIE